MKSSRRSFLKKSAFAGATCIMGTPKFASPSRQSVVVVGAGAFGGWSALQLAEKGAKVTLVDAWGPGNSRASSGGETRTIRVTYGPTHALYVKMVA
jgi:glycine/D-amino acid oxidase-like deaminating enzyme